MLPLVLAVLRSLAAGFHSRRNLVMENLALRHQLLVMNRTVQASTLRHSDRLFWAALCAMWSRWPKVESCHPLSVAATQKTPRRCFEGAAGLRPLRQTGAFTYPRFQKRPSAECPPEVGSLSRLGPRFRNGQNWLRHLRRELTQLLASLRVTHSVAEGRSNASRSTWRVH
jgi:hypothetical protein